MPEYIIEGGTPLRGTVSISGAKNAAIKMVAASLLTPDPLILHNVPQISDIDVDIEIVKSLGVSVVRKDHTLQLMRKKLGYRVPKDLSSKTRASAIVMGPLLAVAGKFEIPEPGGCAIGKRPLDRHIAALESLGAKIEFAKGNFRGSIKDLRGGIVSFDKPSVMATENVILASVLAKGGTIITGAAQEPEVDDLICLLNKMGAKIARDAFDPLKIYIEGVDHLSGAEHLILPDRNEAVTFAIAAAVTGGDVTIKGVEPKDLTAFLAKLEKVGVSYEVAPDRLRVWKEGDFSPLEIETSPHPGFMTDWHPPFVLLLTQAKGESLLHEKVFENRFAYIGSLNQMGASLEAATPSGVGEKFDPEIYHFSWVGEKEPQTFAKISGPTPLFGTKLKIPDLRAGATLVLAALAAKGESIIEGVEHIDRGYEGFEEKLKGLGAQIERLD